MRSLNVGEIDSVSGAEVVCAAGFPSGVKCEGSASDWKQLATDVWNAMADTPGTSAWTITKILER
ncbi:hypothetical protein GCM10027400_12970 [Pseudoxanthomonas daejeonensis]